MFGNQTLSVHDLTCPNRQKFCLDMFALEVYAILYLKNCPNILIYYFEYWKWYIYCAVFIHQVCIYSDEIRTEKCMDMCQNNIKLILF